MLFLKQKTDVAVYKYFYKKMLEFAQTEPDVHPLLTDNYGTKVLPLFRRRNFAFMTAGIDYLEWKREMCDLVLVKDSITSLFYQPIHVQKKSPLTVHFNRV